MTPGMIVRPRASKLSDAEAWARSPIAAILPSLTPISAIPRPAWLTTSPPRTNKSKVSAMAEVRAPICSGQQVFCGGGDRLNGQVHHVTERLVKAWVNHANLFVGPRPANGAREFAPWTVELLIGRSKKAQRRNTCSRRHMHGS